MATYEYRCDACGKAHEQDCSWANYDRDQLKVCPYCGEKEKFGRVFSAPMVIIHGEPTTVEQQAEVNAKRVGKYGIEKIKHEAAKKRDFLGKIPRGGRKIAEPKEKPWFREGLANPHKPLDLSKVKDKTKYIKTGNKD